MRGQFPHEVGRRRPHKQVANEGGILRDAGQRREEIAVAQTPLLYISGTWRVAAEHDPMVLYRNNHVVGE